jgi:hypothetical protein
LIEQFEQWGLVQKLLVVQLAPQLLPYLLTNLPLASPHTPAS